MSLRKAVFPIAGRGTRVLPASKAIPKEMLPVVDKPLIQYAVEEAIAAGMTELIFITGRGEKAIADHFGRAHELETLLEARGREDLLNAIRNIIPDNVKCRFIHQPGSLGLGHAIACAEAAVGNESFAVILPDDLIDTESHGVLRQLVAKHAHLGGSLIAVEDVPAEQIDRYGIVEVDRPQALSARLLGIIEKPEPGTSRSTLAVVGRYILSPGIFRILRQTKPGAGGEIQLTDAIATLLAQEPVHSYRFSGTRYDCGNKLGFLQATVGIGINHSQVGKEFARYLGGITEIRDQLTESSG